MQGLHRRILLIAPLLVTLLVLLVAAALFPASLKQYAPPLLFPMVYFWMIFRPQGYPLAGIFVLGVISDMLMGLPLGLIAALALFAALLLRSQRRFLARQSFAPMWLGWAILSAVLLVLLHGVMSFLEARWFAFSPLLMQWIVSLLIYPPLHWLNYNLLILIPDAHD